MTRILTVAELLGVMPLARKKAPVFITPLNLAMDEWEINNRLRQAAFMAQIAHETASLVFLRELASGAAYDTGRLAERLGNTPEADGDGQKYKGRGPIQITGHDNYLKCSMALYGDNRLLSTPELLEQPLDGCRAAGWFWSTHGLNELADVSNFLRITKVINGGTNGLEERERFYAEALKVLK
jgi:putative chitinase